MFADSQSAPGAELGRRAGLVEPPNGADAEWAWARYEPGPKRPWDLRLAGHLFRRASFGATWHELQQALRDGPKQAVDKLFKPDADVAAFNREYDELESALDPDSEATDSVRGWWLRRMMQTPHPLLEKMTLFWHNHFATSLARGTHALSMHRHLQLIRGHALGRFSELLRAIVTDAAMLVALDAGANRKARPSVPFARDLLELFTVGPGNFSDKDASEVARALTGWFVVRNRVRYVDREHDEGRKIIFGQEGAWTGEDVVRILLAQPATPRLVVRKLYRWLVSETGEPGESLIGPLADSFAKDYDVAKLVETILRSSLFFSAGAYRRRIKSPVEYALGIVRGMEETVNPDPLGHALAELGQNVCHPPTAKGWAGGKAWINQATLIGRSNLAWAMLSGSAPYGDRLNPLSVAEKHGPSNAGAAVRVLLDLYLQGDVEPATREKLMRTAAGAGSARPDRVKLAREIAQTIVTLPEFQLA